MNSVNLDDRHVLTALRQMWERRDPAPADLDALALEAVERAALDDELIVLELLSETLEFENVRGGERTLRFVSHGYEVLLRIVREPDGFRVDGWSTPATSGVARIDVDGRERTTAADDVGRFAFTGVGPGRATVSLAVASDSAPVWATSSFAL